MEPCFSYSSSSKVFQGEFFSVYVDASDSYWVVSNDFPSVFKGPLDKGTAVKLLDCANDFLNLLKLKGL